MNNTIIIPPSHHVAEIAGAAAGVLGIAALALVAKKVLPKSRSRAQRRNRVHFAEPITDYEPVSESNDSLVEATEPLGEHILAEPLIAVAGEDDVKVVIQELAEPATIVESPIIVPAAKIKDVSPAKTNFKENAAPRFKEDVARAKKENDDEEHLSWAEARNKFENMARPSPKNEKRSLSDKFLSSGAEVKPLLTMKHQPLKPELARVWSKPPTVAIPSQPVEPITAEDLNSPTISETEEADEWVPRMANDFEPMEAYNPVVAALMYRN